MTQEITEELLQSHINATELSVRIINILEKNNVFRMIDLFYCCGKVIKCKKGENQSTCQVEKKLIDFPYIGKMEIKKIYK
ncbi:MAG: hypothetical protein V1920_00730, partial [Bacillota bacterium]